MVLPIVVSSNDLWTVVVTRSASGTSADFVEESIVDSKGALGSSWMLEKFGDTVQASLHKEP